MRKLWCWLALATATACSSSTEVTTTGSGGSAGATASCPPADLGASCPVDGVTCESTRSDGCPIHLSCFVQLSPPGYWLVTEPENGTSCNESGKICEYSYSVGDNCAEKVTIRCDPDGWTTTMHVSLPPCSSTGGTGGTGGQGGS